MSLMDRGRTVALSGLFVFATLAGGCGMPSFLVTPISNTNQLNETEVRSGQGWGAKKVALIDVEGMLMNTKSGGFLQPTENPVSLFVQELDRAAIDSDVCGVVLRVNSPGGTVTASDIMYQEVLKFRQKTKKPVVVSTQEICASGAYYISCAADKIVAHPTSVVGSVGVIFENFNLQGTLAKIGAQAETIKSGPLKDMGSPFKIRTTQELAVMQSMVNEYFARFTSVVTTNRPVKEKPPTPEQMEPDYAGVFSGRVFSGQKAVELGLADRTGLLEDAIDLTQELAHTKGAKVIMYKRPYGYSGSIYASSQLPPPQSQSGNTININVPNLHDLLPRGFYYLWEP